MPEFIGIPGAPPPERETAAPGDDRSGGSKQSRAVESYSTTGLWATVLSNAPARHVRALGAVAHALAELRADIFGSLWPGDVSAMFDPLVGLLRRLLGPDERWFLGLMFVAAMEEEDREELRLALEDPFGDNARQRAVGAFIEMLPNERREFLARARRAA